MSMKNSTDAIGNQTRGLAVCSAVPQPTAPPHVPTNIEPKNNLIFSSYFCISSGRGVHSERKIYQFKCIINR